MVLLGTCFSISLAEINKQLRTDFKYICNQKDNKEVNSDKSDNICEKAVACPHQMLSRRQWSEDWTLNSNKLSCQNLQNKLQIKMF